MSYEIIYADPPYMERGGGKSKRGADRHYSLMKTNDIKDIWADIEDKVSDDSFLFLWVTDNFLQDGLDIMGTWGYTYKRTFVWVKDSFGLGFYARGQHEILLLGLKGKPSRSKASFAKEKQVYSSVVFADKQEHSKKPEEFYRIIESFKTERESKCLELFARNTREGWDS